MFKNFTYLIAFAAMFWLWGAAEVHAEPKAKPTDAIKADTTRLLELHTPKRAFVTKMTHKGGSLEGLAGADAICQAAADGRIGLGGVWQAWLSDSTATPTDRWITLALAPYYLLDGRVIAAGYWDLADGAINTMLNKDEFGDTVSANSWTGTNVFGGELPGMNCDDWANTGGPEGAIGTTLMSNDTWTDLSTASCATNQHLYCFEQ